MGRFYGKMLCETGLGWSTGNIDLQRSLEMAFQREKKRIMCVKSVCHKWHSPAMESRGKKQANMPKGDRKWKKKTIRKEEITEERALVQILNLPSHRNTGWYHYPTDPNWGKQLKFLAQDGSKSERRMLQLGLCKYTEWEQFVLVIETPHIPGYVGQEVSLLWVGVGARDPSCSNYLSWSQGEPWERIWQHQVFVQVFV